jgi:prophage regulatory protein
MSKKVTVSKLVPAFITRQDVERLTTLSRTSIYSAINPSSDQYDPSFPKPYRITAQRVGWKPAEIKAWIDSRQACVYGDEE